MISELPTSKFKNLYLNKHLLKSIIFWKIDIKWYLTEWFAKKNLYMDEINTNLPYLHTFI